MLRQLHRGGWGRLVVLLGLAGFVVWVYVVVVLGGGALIGHTDSPSVPLSVLATTVVALLFARVQAALERATIRWGLGAATPYDVLSQFSDAVTSAYATDELPARMAMLLAQGTGARWAQVWLNRLRPPDPGRHLAHRRRRRPDAPVRCDPRTPS